MLRLIAGLESPTEGLIFFGDEDASKKTVQQRNIGFVFQHYALFRHMTVLDNVSFGLKVRNASRRPPRAEIRRRALELLDLVQLSGLEKRYPAQLSGGQRQRVALARAMAVEPNVLLLDEPFGALDAQVRKDLRKWLREIHDRTGHTTVFVTHDQDEAMELADRVVVMSQGAIEQVGTPDEVYDNPNSPFVFGFVGQSNCLAGAGQRRRNLVRGSAARPQGRERAGWGCAALFPPTRHRTARWLRRLHRRPADRPAAASPARAISRSTSARASTDRTGTVAHRRPGVSIAAGSPSDRTRWKLFRAAP